MQQRVVLTCRSDLVTLAELRPVAAALTKQIANDFGPAWSVDATVDVAADGAAPTEGWVITVMDGLDEPEPGYHRSAGGRPYAKVLAEGDWKLTVGHECLEVLADPTGERRITGPRLPPGQGTVDYLLEVCDPCQDATCAYAIDGVPVSDFVLPGFYDQPASSTGRYSFNGKITRPRDRRQRVSQLVHGRRACLANGGRQRPPAHDHRI